MALHPVCMPAAVRYGKTSRIPEHYELVMRLKRFLICWVHDGNWMQIAGRHQCGCCATWPLADQQAEGNKAGVMRPGNTPESWAATGWTGPLIHNHNISKFHSSNVKSKQHKAKENPRQLFHWNCMNLVERWRGQHKHTLSRSSIWNGKMN